jgi:hypothetical protein
MIRHKILPTVALLRANSAKADAGIACSSDSKVASGARKIKHWKRFKNAQAIT